ncbi:MAG: hypothetical protein CSB33_00895 [Desulfobacterales bacterium]|nr:MAG: hypothetical protein CSB33_00895 [Desulfobacterales bacterium]
MKRRLWDHESFHCSIIGTCLNMKEIKRVLRQNQVKMKLGSTEMDVHAAAVSLSCEQNRVSKSLEKLLNKKYASAIRRFLRLTDEADLAAEWQKALDQGDIPGPYWALLSHPGASDSIRNRAFGEVHMLSHLVGASNRVDIRKLAEQEKRLEEMTEKMGRMRQTYKNIIHELRRTNREKQERILEMAAELTSLSRYSSDAASVELQKENERLRKALSSASQERMEMENQRNWTQNVLEKLKIHSETQERRIRDQEAEIVFLEEELTNALPSNAFCKDINGCDKANTPDCPGPLLCGKRILYVGGRTNLIRHYRSLVERHGAEFIHHDGGLEDCTDRLHRMLGTADSVFCPIDCVSHNICLAVKSACKQRFKPLKFLRSSSLSMLSRSLEEMDDAFIEDASAS